MNLMPIILSDAEYQSKDTRLITKINNLKNTLKNEKIRFQETYVKMRDIFYYYNGLPIIPDARDVLKKPNSVCKIRVNWKKKDFTGKTSTEILGLLKEQWAWSVVVVDEEHTRNKFKNKTILWVVFDTEKDALKYMNVFNKLFMTAIEQDAIDEYKKFRDNPAKRPLTFDKLVDNAYDLYEQVDNGEL